MRYLHTMVRVKNLDESLTFYRDGLGLEVVRQNDYEQGRFSLVYLAAPADIVTDEAGNRSTLRKSPELELTYNWDPEEYTGGRNFGHLAYEVDNIFELCEHLQSMGVTINRPPRDGRMAFVVSPDGISIEFLQAGEALAPQEPWASMENTGAW